MGEKWLVVVLSFLVCALVDAQEDPSFSAVVEREISVVGSEVGGKIPEVRHVALDIAVDVAGNVYVGGYLERLPEEGKRDGFVAKLTETSFAEYEKFGTSEDDIVTAIAVDSSSNTIFATGFTEGQLPDAVDRNGSDVFNRIIREGEDAIMFQYGSDGDDVGQAIAVAVADEDDSANFFVGGRLAEQRFSGLGSSAFVASYTADNFFNWGVQIGDSDQDRVEELHYGSESDAVFALCSLYTTIPSRNAGREWTQHIVAIDAKGGNIRWRLQLTKQGTNQYRRSAMSIGSDQQIHVAFSAIASDGELLTAKYMKLGDAGVVLQSAGYCCDGLDQQEFKAGSMLSRAVYASATHTVQILAFGSVTSLSSPTEPIEGDEPNKTPQPTEQNEMSRAEMQLLRVDDDTTPQSTTLFANYLFVKTSFGTAVNQGRITTLFPDEKGDFVRGCYNPGTKRWYFLRKEPVDPASLGFIVAELEYAPEPVQAPKGAVINIAFAVEVTELTRTEALTILGIRQVLQQVTCAFSLGDVIFEKKANGDAKRAVAGEVLIRFVGSDEETIAEKRQLIDAAFEDGSIERAVGCKLAKGAFSTETDGIDEGSPRPTPSPTVEVPTAPAEERPEENDSAAVAIGVGLGLLGLAIIGVIIGVILYRKRDTHFVWQEQRETGTPV